MSDTLAKALAHQSDPTHELQVIRVPPPAAGADWAHVFTGGFVRRIISVAAQLVTSAAVANRAVRLDLTAPEGRVLSIPLPAVITAGLTTQLTWAEGIYPVNTALFDSALSTGFEGMVCPPGFAIGTVSAALDAADQFSNVFIMVESWERLPWTHYQEKLAAYRGEQIAGALADTEE